VPAGVTIVQEGEIGDAAYFILDGQAAAGTPEPDGGYRSLSTMEAGDFFGEIAALTGSRRTATVVAAEPTTVVEVPAPALRSLMAIPELSSLFLTKLTERLNRTNNAELPRFSGVDQASLKDLRTPRPTAEALPKSY
jgi:CRP-like cAMP-binding protein